MALTAKGRPLDISIPHDAMTGEPRRIRVDESGYELLIRGKVETVQRLGAICYLMNPAERMRIALMHGLPDVGEMRMAQAVMFKGSRHPVTRSWAVGRVARNEDLEAGPSTGA